MQLADLLDDDAKVDTRIVAVSTDDHAASKKLVSQIESRSGKTLDAILLEDRDHRVIDRYGILNARHNIAHPAVFVLDKKGVVRWRFVETNYRVRASNAAIVGALGKIK